MKSDSRQSNNKINDKKQLVETKTSQSQKKEGTPAQKDGFRYDYDDNF